MRVISTFVPSETGEDPQVFSYFLLCQGIENEIEEVSPTTFRVWVHDEDQIEKAQTFYHAYQQNPQDSRFRTPYEELLKSQQKPPPPSKERRAAPAPAPTPRRRRLLSPSPYGPITIAILITVTILFFWSQVQRKMVIAPKIPGVVQAPVLAPIEQKLLIDYPAYFQLRDELLTLYTPEEIEEHKPPSQEARQLIQRLQKTPVWMGIYDLTVLSLQDGEEDEKFKGSLFESIRKGQVWRLFTPALLHFDLLHIFFNVLWFILLGNQIEHRLRPSRYLALIILTAIFSNTAQYLVSGPFFMGLSGVVCGMAAFIFARQQVAPWEGYLLHRFTLIFLAIFVIGMFLIQIALFFLQIFSNFELTVGIANTAHLIGALVGYLLGRLRLFSLCLFPK
ncbi:MAG: Rhomboid protease GlpG [Chlamydiae bacterium]|nr:Rhomboid protease GlpG [Chlamydiota bacterium]